MVDRFLEGRGIKIGDREGLIREKKEKTFQFGPGGTDWDNGHGPAILFEVLPVVEVFWIVRKTRQVNLVVHREIFDLVKRSDFISFVGWVRNAMGEI